MFDKLHFLKVPHYRLVRNLNATKKVEPSSTSTSSSTSSSNNNNNNNNNSITDTDDAANNAAAVAPLENPQEGGMRRGGYSSLRTYIFPFPRKTRSGAKEKKTRENIPSMLLKNRLGCIR
jgi:hypothetical protein